MKTVSNFFNSYYLLACLSITIIGCSKSDEQQDEPKVTLETGTSSIFLLQNFEAKTSDTSSKINYTYDFGDGTVLSTAGITVHKYQTPGMFTITLKNGNKTIDSKKMNVRDIHFSIQVQSHLSFDITDARVAVLDFSNRTNTQEIFNKTLGTIKAVSLTDSVFIKLPNWAYQPVRTTVKGRIRRVSSPGYVDFQMELRENDYTNYNAILILPSTYAYFINELGGRDYLTFSDAAKR
ncbi:PKD domain-containing protein [Mucilaginibacter terrae]|uniref:PKD domain-containing protein n=1 Tax=Mucilaginibacter terrae TaxID=1955052 RepID=A0ABU3GVY6_9SPHI|nr:PKD domain-containing protein [Mucilaginibacter terrae]MDT3403928.1 hypothetical protein [Mucilaginibacter terrae]